MSIPLVSNVGFTEITQSSVDSNSGILNDIAGTAKSKLPLQYFKLGENISGNLTMNNDSSHKKIILDTGGNTLLNSAGSPLTQNSSTALELKGSGNVQSTLKTSTLTQSDATHTGTTNFANSDSSTIVVSNVGTDLTVEKYKDFTRTSNSGGFANIAYTGSDIDSGVTTIGGSTPNASTIFSDTSVSSGNTFNTNGGTPVFIGDTATSSSSPASYNYQLYIATVANTTIGLRMDEYANIGSSTVYSQMGFGGLGGNHNSHQANKHQIGFYNMFSVGPSQDEAGYGNLTFTRRFWFRFIRSGNDRSFVFTNNLNIACVLSGADPFDGVTVNSGATATSTASNTTDGTYNITMTISGNDGNSHPYALAKFNNGTGTVDLTTQGYTGTRSSDGAID
tara:strand:- start:1298 stop:2476 length:1179 start_codon:yes stop_codon:yes gene_type:complete